MTLRENKRKCIVVLGMHRSGTSAIAGFLASSGVFFGNNLLEPQEDNPKGFFENKSILQINENILKILGSKWDDVNDLPNDWHKREEISIFKINIKEIIKNDLNKDVFGLKDPRVSILLPLYLEVFSEMEVEPLFLIIKRKKIEIFKSLEKRNDFSYQKTISLSNKYEKSIKLYTKNYTKYYVFFDDIVNDLDSFVYNFQKIFGINLNVDFYAKSFIEKDLKHYTISYNELIQKYQNDLNILNSNVNEVRKDNKILKKVISDNEASIDQMNRRIAELSKCIQEVENRESISNQEIIQKNNEIKLLKESLSWRFSQWMTKVFFLIFSNTYRTRRMFEKIIRFLHKLFKKRNVDLISKKKLNEELIETPLISVIMPTYNTDIRWLELAIESVNNQTYRNWELCIVDDGSTSISTINFLKNINDEKIKVHFLSINEGIANASNEAIKMCQGDYVGFLDHDDEITPDALFEVAKAVNKFHPDFVYSDEDKIDLFGNLIDTHHKPTFSPDLLLSQNYICHFTVIKKELIEKVGGFNSKFNGSQDYDLFLRITEITNNILHIPKVLYHWRQIEGSTSLSVSNKSYAVVNGKNALHEALLRRGIVGEVIIDDRTGYYRVKREILISPLVSIVIPFRNGLAVLKKCFASILSKSTYNNYEIIAIDNFSNEEGMVEWKKYMQNHYTNIFFYKYDKEFNYSAINNYAAQLCRGDHILFLNNDVEIISNDWIQSMLEQSQRDEVGVVGAKLFYPDDTIQHAGVIIGMGGVAGHAHKTISREDHGYFSRASVIQNISAVTGACMMMKKSIFNRVGGFDETLAVAFNDIDICLRVRECGYLNIYTPYAELYHYESYTRGSDLSLENQKRFKKEITIFTQKHSKILNEGDPYFNQNFDLMCEVFTLKK